MLIWLFAAAFGVLFVVMAASVWQKVRLMKRTPTVPCGDLATQAHLPGDARLEITGIAEPGPGGPLRAPLSGEPCVWYGLRVVSKPKLFGGRRQKVAMPRQKTSAEPFGVRDETGLARVLPAGVETQSGTLQVNASEDAPPVGYGPAAGSLAARAGRVLGVSAESTEGRSKYQEWIVSPGAPVYVLGAAMKDDETGDIVLGSGSGRFVIGAGGEAEVVRSLRRKSLTMLGIGLLLVVPSLTFLIAGTIAILAR